jgi:hypothetical protein
MGCTAYTSVKSEYEAQQRVYGNGCGQKIIAVTEVASTGFSGSYYISTYLDIE